MIFRYICERKGFTLLEIMITIVLLATGIVAITEVFNAGLFTSTDAEKVDLALNIAQANLETIKNQNFADIDTDAEISNLVSNKGFSDFTVSGNVAEGQDPMQVDVTVAWNVRGGTTSVTLVTLVTDYQ